MYQGALYKFSTSHIEYFYANWSILIQRIYVDPGWLGYQFIGKCITTTSEFKNVFAIERDLFGTEFITWLVPTLILIQIISSRTNY